MASARETLDQKIAALGAIRLREAAVARRINPHTLYEWARRERGKSPFMGPRRILVVRETELDAELERFRCGWPTGCTAYALLSESGLCKRHEPDVPRSGKLAATEFARKHRIHPPDLTARLEAGEVPGQRVDRKGRHGAWLLDEEDALAVLDERFRCGWEDCPRFALGPTGYCSDHAGAASSIRDAKGKVALECAKCGTVREDFPSQQRQGNLCHDCNLEIMAAEQHAHRRQERDRLRSAGLVLVSDLAQRSSRPVGTLYRLMAEGLIRAKPANVQLPVRRPLVITGEHARNFLREHEFGGPRHRARWRERMLTAGPPGRPPADEFRQRLLRLLEKVIAEEHAASEPLLSQNYLLGAVALRDSQTHPEAWSNYPGIDSSRQVANAAIARVRGLLSGHLNPLQIT